MRVARCRGSFSPTWLIRQERGNRVTLFYSPLGPLDAHGAGLEYLQDPVTRQEIQSAARWNPRTGTIVARAAILRLKSGAVVRDGRPPEQQQQQH